MMIDYYRQNEMRTKNCYKNCVTFIIAIWVMLPTY